MKKSSKRAAARSRPARSKTAQGGKASKRKVQAAPRARGRSAPPAAAAPAAEPFYLKLESSCTLREAADMQFSLVAANGDPVEVDGSGVERVDTAGLQLLVALARRQQQAGRRLTWKAASQTLLKSSERLGLIDTLGLAAAPPGDAS